MTRIIAIVVVIAAAVIAYMYTSAGDVEVGEQVTNSQPAEGDADAASTDVAGEEEGADVDATVTPENQPEAEGATTEQPAEEAAPAAETTPATETDETSESAPA
ncbi:MAG TPA: hypothetical protein VM899_09005, partial [Rubellimicrobium sp.]|nr:hypothetical protein [Rubellimicrobium sp.]